MNKLDTLFLSAFLSVTGFIKNLTNDLAEDERGLSGVVVAILLILVAVLAVVMIWGFLSGWLQDMWDKIVNANTIG